MRITTMLSLTLAGMIAATAAMAQEQPVLQGLVTGHDGEPVAGAVARLGGSAAADTTASDGVFVLPVERDGRVLLTLSHPDPTWEGASMTVTLPRPPGAAPLAIVLKERVFRADEVVVVAPRRSAGEREPGPAAVTVVSRTDIPPTMSTVAEVIAATPGAVVTSLGGRGDYAEVSLRGSYASQVQVYLDGVLLNEASGGAVNLAAIPLAAVERITLWRSGAPARFGGSAGGGVVSIETSRAGAGRGTASLTMGSFGTTDLAASAGFTAGTSQIDLSGQYTGATNDFRYPSDNGTLYTTDDDYWARRENDRYHAGHLAGSWRWIAGERLLFDLSGNYFSTDKELPATDNARSASASLVTDRALAQLNALWRPGFRGVDEIAPSIAFTSVSEHYDDRGGTIGWGAQDNRYTTRQATFRAPVSGAVGRRVSWTVTPLFRRETFDADYRLRDSPGMSADRNQAAIAGETVVVLASGRVRVTLDGRSEWTGSSSEGERKTGDTEEARSRRDTVLSGGMGMLWQIGGGIGFRTSLTGAHRIPSLTELFGDRGRSIANPEIEPEYIRRGDAGLVLTRTAFGPLRDVSAEYAWFEQGFDDLIQWYLYPAGFATPANVGGGWVRGHEITWAASTGPFRCSGAWTIQQSRVTSETRAIYRDKRLPNRPETLGTLRLEAPLFRARVCWTLDHKGPYYLDPANREYRRYPGRTLHDLGASVPLAGGRIILTAALKNIGNEHTYDLLGLPLPGRSWETGISCRW